MSADLAPSIFEQVGGQIFFDALVERFYAGVATDTKLLALYPTPEDLTDAKHHLALFLAQYWGGPTAYLDLRGPPRLRMRHAPFEIRVDVRDRWLMHMGEALRAMDIPSEELREEMESYFAMAADSLRNQLD